MVIEDYDDHFKVTAAKVRHDRQKIKLAPAETFRNIEAIKRPRIQIDRLVLALDSKRALSIDGLVRLKRTDPQEPITEAELDTLVFRGLWEFLNRYRPLAAGKLLVPEPDLVLAEAAIREVQIGPHRVFNPVDFKGETISFLFQGTFLRRSDLDSVLKVKGWARKISIVERNRLLALSLHSPAEVFLIVGERTTDIFAPLEGLLVRAKKIDWGRANVLSALSKFLSVDGETALKILDIAARGLASERMKRAVETVLRGEFGILDKLFARNFKTRRSTRRPAGLYIDCFPDVSDLSLGKLSFRLAYPGEYIEKSGYDVIIKPSSDPGICKSALALISYPYILPQFDYLNRILEKRAKWLTAHV